MLCNATSQFQHTKRWLAEHILHRRTASPISQLSHGMEADGKHMHSSGSCTVIAVCSFDVSLSLVPVASSVSAPPPP